MNVGDLMSRDLHTCESHHSLACAARTMWERDCGSVPIVDAAGRPVGMITDRDICMAAVMQNDRPSTIPIATVAMKTVVTVRATDSAERAEMLMQKHQLRRLGVVNEDGRLIGIISLNDLARCSGVRPKEIPVEHVGRTLTAISQPHQHAASAE